jgi:hypothetical protein
MHPRKILSRKPEGMLQNFGLKLLNFNGAGDGTRTHNSLLGRHPLNVFSYKSRAIV